MKSFYKIIIYMNKTVFLILITIIILVIIGNFYLKSMESFTSLNSLHHSLEGSYPKSQEEYLVQDSYKRIEEIGISNNDANDIWWNYPIFQLGSYAQITNNIRYPDSPDEGTCAPASMCGALYQPKEILGPHNYGVNEIGGPLQLKQNYVEPLPSINPNTGTRVGYFTTNSNLLPFKTDVVNILY